MRYPPGSIFPRKNSNQQERNAALYVRIGVSQIPGAGQGAFAAAPIPAGVDLGPYRGVVLSKDQMNAKYGAEGGVYIAEIPRPDADRPEDAIMYVDAVDATDPEKSNWTRYMNDPHNTTLTPNVELHDDGHFVSICAIATGCELLWSYGSKYWPDDDDVVEIHQIKTAGMCNCGALKGPINH